MHRVDWTKRIDSFVFDRAIRLANCAQNVCRHKLYFAVAELQALRYTRFVESPLILWHHGRTARTDLRFQWGGDTAGQGWGINPGSGGMKIYEAMRQRDPLFFIHSGDNIYADGPIAETVVAERGLVWNNIVTPQVVQPRASRAFATS